MLFRSEPSPGTVEPVRSSPDTAPGQAVTPPPHPSPLTPGPSTPGGSRELLELAAPVRTSLVGLLEEPELLAIGQQMEAEDFADLVQDLPQERVDSVLAQLSTHERAEVQSVLSFPEGSVGAIMHVHAWVDGVDATEINYPCGTAELADAVADLIRVQPDPGHAIIGLKNHGLTITGESLDEIFDRVEPHILRQIPMS